MTSTEAINDFDSPWKEALDFFFEPFLAFFFPDVHTAIDWSRPVEFLDKEFQEFVRGSEQGRRVVDKLAKVWLKDGSQQCIYIHAELQGHQEQNFSERVFTYHYRIYDKYHAPVVSVVVLMDESDGGWCDGEFGYSHFGCELRFKFPVVKLDAYRGKIQELERSVNPIALLVLAHLRTQETKKDNARRVDAKVELVVLLAERGFTEDVIRKIARVVDWLLYLPDNFKKQFQARLERLEEESQVPFVDFIEEREIKAEQKGLQKGLQQGEASGLRRAIVLSLRNRFNLVPDSVAGALDSVSEMTTLQELLDASFSIANCADFQSKLQEYLKA